VLSYLSHLKESLEVLDITKCLGINGSGLTHLQGFNKLKVLKMPFASEIREENISPISTLTGLTSVNILRCANLTSGFLKNLQRSADTLQSLNCSNLKSFKDEDLLNLSTMTNLTELFLNNNSGITGEAFKKFGHLEKLQVVQLSGCEDLTNEGVRALCSASPFILDLNLAACEKLDGKALQHVKQLSKLRNLNLAGIESLKDSDLQNLAALKNTLSSLNLEGCTNITSGAAAHIASLTNLSHLNITTCDQISDSFLDAIKEMKQLKNINVTGCPKISKEALEALRKARPDLEIKS
jgi:hypothetical protein